MFRLILTRPVKGPLFHVPSRDQRLSDYITSHIYCLSCNDILYITAILVIPQYMVECLVTHLHFCFLGEP